MKQNDQPKKNIIREHLITLISGEQTNVNLEGALAGLKKENRTKRPAKNVHSVWEEVEHIKISQEDILNYIIDPKWKSPEWPDKYWPENPSHLSDEKWKTSIDKIIYDQNELIKIVKDESIDLTQIIPHTNSHTYMREILLATAHANYHVGQIIIIRKFLDDWHS